MAGRGKEFRTMRCPACESNDTTDALLCAVCIDMFFSNPKGSFQERSADWKGAAVTLLSWVETPGTYPPPPPEWRNRVHPPEKADPVGANPHIDAASAGGEPPAIPSAERATQPSNEAAPPVKAVSAPPPQQKTHIDLSSVFEKIAAEEEAASPPPVQEKIGLERVFKNLDETVLAPVPQDVQRPTKQVDETELAAFFQSLNAIAGPPATTTRKVFPQEVRPPASEPPINSSPVKPLVPATEGPSSPSPPPPTASGGKKSLLDFVHDAYGESKPAIATKKETPTTPVIETIIEEEDDGNLLDGLTFSSDAGTDWLGPSHDDDEDREREIEI